MCMGGGGDKPKVAKYEPVKDPQEAQTARRTDDNARRQALYGMSATNKTGGLGLQGNAFTSAPQATFGGATNTGATV